MPKVTLSKEMHERVTQFKNLVEAVAQAELDIDTCTEVILQRGIDLMLSELLGQVGEEALLTTVQKLGSRHPAQVYNFIAEVWKIGVDEEKQEQLRNRFGFHATMKQPEPEE
ncbi:MAG: hypothetical protein JNJ77_06785 [Planctomycetia bacterium]|nr:hypothetical protein [Planctomycetia bacterium]